MKYGASGYVCSAFHCLDGAYGQQQQQEEEEEEEKEGEGEEKM